MGMWFQLNGFEMRLHHRTWVKTDAPTTIVGPYPNYYNQRVRSWDMAEHVYAWEFFKLLFFTRHKTFFGTVVLKWFQFYSCYSIVADWMRIPVMVLSIMVNASWFFTISGIFVVGYTILVIIWDSIGYRYCPQRKSRLLALLTFQTYKIPAVLIRLLGMIRAFTVYLPNFQAKPTIPELEEVVLRARDPSVLPKKPVWMERSNPYYEHYLPSNPAAVTRPISPLGIPDELATIQENFEQGDEDGNRLPSDIVPSVPLPGDDAFGEQPDVLRPSTRRFLSPEFTMDKIPEYIPRNIVANPRNNDDISAVSGGFSLFKDDTSELSLPTAIQSIREQLAGELSREEAAKRKEAARARVREIEGYIPNPEAMPEEFGHEMEQGLPKVHDPHESSTEGLTESSGLDLVFTPPPETSTAPPGVPPLPAHRLVPSRHRPRQKISYTAIQ